MMGGQNVELSVARLNVCTVLHVKPEKNLGGQEATKGGRMPPCAPPLNATLHVDTHILCAHTVRTSNLLAYMYIVGILLIHCLFCSYILTGG